MPKKKQISIKLDSLKKMPPCYHTLPNQTFDYKNSELVKWIFKQSIILDWLCQCMINTKYIRFNPVTQKWQGIDYEEDNND